MRTEKGRLHVGTLKGRRYETACYRTITVGAAVVYAGRDRLGRKRAVVAWRHELQCLDCRALAARGDRELQRVAGWC